ncbi:MAG TPA: peptidyl-prolyl cis-trans isomerase [Candidatus Saccharimonadales bacterium]|nr:peptidyl-prolyl cis-trans isomerase [Candidatus Saccharimonadales bacterium]
MRSLLALILVLAAAAAAVTGAAAAKAKKPVHARAASPAHAVAPGDSTAHVMATLDGQPYTVADWIRDLPPESRQAARTTADRLRVLDQLFEARLLLLGAERTGVARDSAVAARLEGARRQILIGAYLDKVVRPLAAADSTEISAWYRDHPDDYRVKESVTVRHIQVPTLKDAQRVRTELQLGRREFVELAKEVSTDSSTRADGGALGTVTRDGYFRNLGRQAAVAETLMTLPEGGLSRPLEINGSWHIFRVDTHEPSRLQPLDAVREQIRGRLEREKATLAYRAHLEALRRQYHFHVDSAVVADSSLFLPAPAELFRQAQTTSDPQARIMLYQELLSLYPGSSFCDQAQFMIGFVCSEELSDFDRAEREFKTLIEKYPKSELRKSAEWMLENMRKGTPTFELPDSLQAQPAPGAADKPGKK